MNDSSIHQQVGRLEGRLDSLENQHLQIRGDIDRRFDELKKDMSNGFKELRDDEGRREQKLDDIITELKSANISEIKGKLSEIEKSSNQFKGMLKIVSLLTASAGGIFAFFYEHIVAMLK